MLLSHGWLQTPKQSGDGRQISIIGLLAAWISMTELIQSAGSSYKPLAQTSETCLSSVKLGGSGHLRLSASASTCPQTAAVFDSKEKSTLKSKCLSTCLI